MANTCESHEPLVCKLCMKEWLRQCETCPICRAVVHARAVMPEKRKRTRSESGGDVGVNEEEQHLEAQFVAAREDARRKEREEQERRDAELARQLANDDDEMLRRDVRLQARLAQLRELDMLFTLALPHIFGPGAALPLPMFDGVPGAPRPSAPRARHRPPAVIIDDDDE